MSTLPDEHHEPALRDPRPYRCAAGNFLGFALRRTPRTARSLNQKVLGCPPTLRHDVVQFRLGGQLRCRLALGRAGFAAVIQKPPWMPNVRLCSLSPARTPLPASGPVANGGVFRAPVSWD